MPIRADSGGGGGSNSAGILQASSVTLSGGDVTTGSTGFVDLTGATITLTTGAHRCIVSWIINAFNNGGADVRIALLIDGVSQGGATLGNVYVTNQAVNQACNMSCTFLTAVLTAASHTFKLQWRTTASTSTAKASDPPLIFQVMETGLTT